MATEFVHRRGPATSSPTRSAPNERIDGISALVKALARALLRDSSRSPYGDGRSMLIPEWGQFIRPGSGTSEPGYSHPLSDCEH